MTSASNESLDTLHDLVKDIRFAMLAWTEPDGSLRSQPMTTLGNGLSDDGRIHFFVSKAASLGQAVARGADVNVSYSNPAKDAYVSVCGRASLSGDEALKRELFNVFAKAWFPGGVDDPDLALLVVDAQSAEYWNVRESQPVQLFKLMKAAATGERPHLGESGKLSL